jgi:hypothetical protein
MASPHPETIRLFISYSHDSREHMDRVLALSNRLRADGIDCHIDQYELSPPEGWPRWMIKHIATAAFVLVVCTETYTRRVNGIKEVGKGLGVKWEGAILTQELYEAETHNTKFIPVVFSTYDAAHIPIVLRGVNYYAVNTEEGYEALYRRLTNQPRILMPELGKVRPMPPLERTEEFLTALASNPQTFASTTSETPASDKYPEVSPAAVNTSAPPGYRLRRFGASWLCGGLLAGGAAWIVTLAPAALPAGTYHILGLFLALLSSLFVFFLTREMGSEVQSMKSPLGRINSKVIGSLAIFILVLVLWWSPLVPIAIEMKAMGKIAESHQFRSRIGERVLSKWKGDGYFYPGEITGVQEGKYQIFYDFHGQEWVEENDVLSYKVPNMSELGLNTKVYVQIDQIHNRWVPAIIKGMESNEYVVVFIYNNNSRYERVPLQKIVR